MATFGAKNAAWVRAMVFAACFTTVAVEAPAYAQPVDELWEQSKIRKLMKSALPEGIRPDLRKKLCVVPPLCGLTVSKTDCDELAKMFSGGEGWLVPIVKLERDAKSPDQPDRLLKDARTEKCAFAIEIRVDEEGNKVISTFRAWNAASGEVREWVASTFAEPFAVPCIGSQWTWKALALSTDSDPDSPTPPPFKSVEECVASQNKRDEKSDRVDGNEASNALWNEFKERWYRYLMVEPRVGLTLNESSADAYKSRGTGFSGGVGAKIFFLGSLDAEILYSIKSVRQGDKSVSLHYLDVPVLLKLLIPPITHGFLPGGPELYGGGQASFKFYSEVADTEAVYFSWVWGVDFIVPTAWADGRLQWVFVDVRFNGGSTTIGGRGVFLKVMTISVGYDF